VGHQRDPNKVLLVDAESGAIRSELVRPSNWSLGHDVPLAPQWIKQVSWAGKNRDGRADLRCLGAPPRYDASVPLTREMEIAVFKHDGRTGYWTDEAGPPARDVPNQADA
jgi:hypothetical protein